VVLPEARTAFLVVVPVHTSGSDSAIVIALVIAQMAEWMLRMIG